MKEASQMSIFSEVSNSALRQSATLSSCGRYRYSLTRNWNDDLPYMVYVGLNPSTADANVDDPTIRRLIHFTKAYNMGGFTIVNLFAFRATNPDDMMLQADPIGKRNDFYIDLHASNAAMIVFCWGTNGRFQNRDQQITKRFPNALCFGKTTKGHPKHPLYLPNHTLLTPF